MNVRMPGLGLRVYGLVLQRPLLFLMGASTLNQRLLARNRQTKNWQPALQKGPEDAQVLLPAC